MTTELNALLDRLRLAIDEAISDSGRVGAIVAEVQKAGYDLCLMVESSAAITPAGTTSPESHKPAPELVPLPPLAYNGDIPLTGEDLAFLGEMHICVEA